nr:hypothetical protein [Mycobacterium lepromatosis]
MPIPLSLLVLVWGIRWTSRRRLNVGVAARYIDNRSVGLHAQPEHSDGLDIGHRLYTLRIVSRCRNVLA